MQMKDTDYHLRHKEKNVNEEISKTLEERKQYQDRKKKSKRKADTGKQSIQINDAQNWLVLRSQKLISPPLAHGGQREKKEEDTSVLRQEENHRQYSVARGVEKRLPQTVKRTERHTDACNTMGKFKKQRWGMKEPNETENMLVWSLP